MQGSTTMDTALSNNNGTSDTTPRYPTSSVKISTCTIDTTKDEMMMVEPKATNIRPESTVLILDWDDTLLPSSWITSSSHRLDLPLAIDAETRQALVILENSVVSLFTSILACKSHCIIITNAETGWVELSCAKFMPRLLPYLAQIRVISARSNYEWMYPDSPLEWKLAAFDAELSTLFPLAMMPQAAPGAMENSRMTFKNIISFGDSFHEREAIYKVSKTLGPQVHTKSIKFVERPTIEQLHYQVDMVTGYFQHILHHEDDLDLMLSIEEPLRASAMLRPLMPVPPPSSSNVVSSAALGNTQSAGRPDILR